MASFNNMFVGCGSAGESGSCLRQARGTPCWMDGEGPPCEACPGDGTHHCGGDREGTETGAGLTGRTV